MVATLKVGKSVVENTEKLIKLNAELGKTGEILLNLQRKAADEAAKAVTEKQNAERAVQKSEDLQKNLATKESLLAKEKQKVDKKDKELSALRVDLTQKGQKLKQANDQLEIEQVAVAKERGEIVLSRANVAAREGLLRDKDAELSEMQTTITSLKEDLKRSRGKGVVSQGWWKIGESA